MSTEIKVFKLVSGDEIIGSVVNNDNDAQYVIEKPMIFQTTTMLDEKGYPYDITILRDWMVRTDDKIAHVPKNQISIVFSPNEQTINLYNLELKRIESTPSEELLNLQDVNNTINSMDKETMEEIMQDFFNNIDGLAKENLEFKKEPRKRKKKKLPKVPTDEFTFQSLIPDELKKRPMIYLSMVIPPEAIMNLITSGILDPEQLLAMIEEVKKNNKFTGDEKKRKDFGNKFSDWNPDPESEDY